MLFLQLPSALLFSYFMLGTTGGKDKREKDRERGYLHLDTGVYWYDDTTIVQDIYSRIRLRNWSSCTLMFKGRLGGYGNTKLGVTKNGKVGKQRKGNDGSWLEAG